MYLLIVSLVSTSWFFGDETTYNTHVFKSPTACYEVVSTITTTKLLAHKYVVISNCTKI